MPFLSHLVELRDRVRNAAIAFIVAFVVCWIYADQRSSTWLKRPLFSVWDVKKLGEPHLVFGKLTEPFWVGMSIALWAGIFAASPFIFYQLWKFIAPGLYKKERDQGRVRRVLRRCSSRPARVLLLLRARESLRVPARLRRRARSQPMILMQDYLDLTRDMMLAFGAVFELPLLIYFLAMIGMVTHRGLWKFNRWFIVIAFVVGAILTPSPDVVSQILMASPMIVLYNFSILARVARHDEARARRSRSSAPKRDA